MKQLHQIYSHDVNIAYNNDDVIMMNMREYAIMG